MSEVLSVLASENTRSANPSINVNLLIHTGDTGTLAPIPPAGTRGRVLGHIMSLATHKIPFLMFWSFSLSYC